MASLSFSLNARATDLHGLDANAEGFGDAPGFLALSEPPENFQFAIAQLVHRRTSGLPIEQFFGEQSLELFHLHGGGPRAHPGWR